MSAPAHPSRLLLVTHYFPAHGGGVEIVAGEIARRVAASGVAVEWFASAGDEPPVLPGVECRPQPVFNATERWWGVPFPLWSPLALARVVGAVRRADVVHIHDAVYAANVVAALAALVLGKRLVVTQHVGEIPYKRASLRTLLAAANRFAARAILRHADETVFVSPVVRRYFERLAGAGVRFRTIANGVDLNLFGVPDVAERQRIRRDLNLAPTSIVALFVGRFVEKKGLAIVRELAARLPAWHWCLIGSGPIDPLAWRLPNVHVPGRLGQREVAQWYQAADLLVLPSVGEGFPLVVQEALASGLPVAVHTETREAGALPLAVCIDETVAGADAVERWLARLHAFAALPEEHRQAMRAACRDVAASRWSWDATCREYGRMLFPAVDASAPAHGRRVGNGS